MPYWNRIKKIAAVGLLLGFALLAVQIAFQIDSKVLLHWYWRIGGCVIVLAVLLNLVYMVWVSRRMKEIMLLYEQKKYSEYEAKMEEMLLRTKGRYPKTVIKLNLAAGYIEDQKYKKAEELLRTVEMEHIRDKNLKLAYAINICIVCFKLADYVSFDRIYTQEEVLFQQNVNHRNYGESIAQLHVMHDIAAGKYLEAEKSLRELRMRWPGEDHQKDYEELDQVIRRSRIVDDRIVDDQEKKKEKTDWTCL